MIDEELNKKVLESLKRMNRIEKPFYDEGYICGKGQDDAIVMDTGNPVEIYSFLTSHVYKQDRYCRDAAMILYDHLRGITSRNIVCGPPGCGKTYVWECLQQVFPQILIVDAATLSKDGWGGGNKVSDFIDLVDPTKRDYIVVFDEFDKCATPQYSSYHENVSASLQSEFLKLVEGKRIKRKIGSEEIAVDTSEMSFVFCGSFAQKADEISMNDSSSGMGFGGVRKKSISFEKELNMADLIEFGVIKELASRCTRLINIRPLTLEDYIYLVTDYEGSPIKSIEKKYGMEIDISDEQMRKIAKNAYESGLGIRNVTAQIQSMMDDRIFKSFLNSEETPETLLNEANGTEVRVNVL